MREVAKPEIARRVEAALQSFTLPGRAPAILLDAATALVPIDAALARETFAEALQACLVSSKLTFGTTPALVGIYLDQSWHKPGYEPPLLTHYLPRLALCAAGAGAASLIAWRWGGSPQGRWATHGTVATVILVMFWIGSCFWMR